MNERNLRGSTSDLTEWSLLVQAKAGNPYAIDELVRRYWRDAYLMANRILGRHEDAEEAAQDTIYAAIAGLASFRGAASFRTWLYRITLNACLTTLRRRLSNGDEVTIPVSDTGVLERLAGQSANPEQLLLAAEQRQFAQQSLDRLPKRYASVIRLFWCEGLSIREVADALGISESAVKIRLYRARRRLREDRTRS